MATAKSGKIRKSTVANGGIATAINSGKLSRSGGNAMMPESRNIVAGGNNTTATKKKAGAGRGTAMKPGVAEGTPTNAKTTSFGSGRPASTKGQNMVRSGGNLNSALANGGLIRRNKNQSLTKAYMQKKKRNNMI